MSGVDMHRLVRRVSACALVRFYSRIPYGAELRVEGWLMAMGGDARIAMESINCPAVVSTRPTGEVRESLTW